MRYWLIFVGVLASLSANAATNFSALKVEKVAGDFKFVEGPLWNRAGYLLFSDIPANIIYKWTPGADGGKKEVFREPSGNSNGLTYDRQGRLIACEHSNRRVSRTEAGGAVVAIADSYQGRRLNSPNDVVVGRDGTIYFTDPPYGVPKDQKREIDTQNVYRLSPDGKLSVISDDFDRPNGIALSPDEKTLYVNDTVRKHVRAFALGKGGSGKKGGAVIAELKSEKPGGPDGMKVDVKGNLYVTGAGGIWVFDKKGRHLGTIPVPEMPANCAFGDADYKTLYITARTSLYRVRLPHPGYRTY